MPESPTPTLLRPTPRAEPAAERRPPSARPPRVKRLRLGLILTGLGGLALVSTVFGMMMAVASDLPALENEAQFRAAKNSVLLAAGPGHPPIARLTGNRNRILLGEHDISPMLENAIIAIEDRRFYQHEGVDYTGIARALVQDLLRRKAAQGGSTITQQFVKNALAAQGQRSVFEKLREAALAYHLERRWTKQKILTQYLNTVYFGNGAYGAEAAMRTYFGAEHQAQGEPVAQGRFAATHVKPHEAALLAGMIASPSLYDPLQNPGQAKARRDTVLKRMLEQGMLTPAEYESSVRQALPATSEVKPPAPDSTQPYFSSWLTQQLVDRYRPGVVFGGGLKIRTTIDPALQKAAEQAISQNLTGVGPSASLVAIENKTGEVKAMVGGNDFERTPFNLATNGHRQPGSAFKPFTLVAALQKGVSPDDTFTSQPKVLRAGGAKFVVHNYQDQYSGISNLRSATAQSDNSVFAELGLKVGTHRIARLARRMGIRTPLSTNPAMTLGGLEEGVTPLEMAYAYSVIANRGLRVTGSLGSSSGPVGIDSVEGSGHDQKNDRRTVRVFPKQVGDQARDLLTGVIQNGTGQVAQIPEFAAGKTGTTENYGDAWFVGFNDQLTVAVWVGYPTKLREMKTEYRGGPVAGGTFPAQIWHDFMTSFIGIRDERNPPKDMGTPLLPSAPLPTAPPSTGPEQTPQTTPEASPQRQPAEPKQPRQQPATPAPAPATPPATPTPPGGGGGAPAAPG
jgi:penicillin-binding protein 1A